jgi:hypothetical protein
MSHTSSRDRLTFAVVNGRELVVDPLRRLPKLVDSVNTFKEE